MRILRDPAELVALREQWDALFDASVTAAPPLRFEWQSEWWRVYGPVYGRDHGGLNVVTVWKDGRLTGVVPLYRRVEGRILRHARLQFLSTGEAEFEETCPEYMDILAQPGEEQAVVAALQRALRTQAIARWDDLVFMDLSERSALLTDWRADRAGGCAVVTEPRGGCPIADLEGGFEAYLGRLSANSRQHFRRILRDAQRAGATLELASTSADVDPWFDDLVELHQDRWRAAGKAGCFSSSRFTDFHRSLARQLVPRSAAVLARLSVSGRPLAVVYGFLTGPKFDFYQSGVRLDGSSSVARPGIAAHLLLMSHLCGRGVTRYDFLRGSADYKQRLATTVQPLMRLRVVRPSLRSLLWATAGVGRRAIDRMARATVRRRSSELACVVWQSTAMIFGTAG